MGVIYQFRFIAMLIYLVNGFAFYKIGKIRGVQYPWLAFIPVFNLYMIGVVGDSLKYTNYNINKHFDRIPLALALPLAYVVFDMLSFPTLFARIGQLALYLLQLMIMYLVFEFYDSKNKILFTVLSVIPVVPSILILYVTRKIKI
ncbi:MAG: hypothetical protein RR048_04205 [Oscillospiraceae bacterium]